jgi:hypothetical protein
MSIASILGSEPVLTLVGTAMGTMWTLIKSSEWYARRRNRRYHDAILSLEAGVEQTYRTYVQSIKEGREDGRLTGEERRRARQLARHTAVRYGQTTGVDVLRELGEEFIDVWIGRMVRRMKRKS